jgi:hypothetical protein
MRAHMLATVLRYPDTEFIVGYDPERDYPGGADRIAYQLATLNGWPIKTFPYHYHKGHGGGPSRNAEMLAEGRPQQVFAYRRRPDSRGTNDMIRRAQGAGIETIIVDYF